MSLTKTTQKVGSQAMFMGMLTHGPEQVCTSRCPKSYDSEDQEPKNHAFGKPCPWRATPAIFVFFAVFTGEQQDPCSVARDCETTIKIKFSPFRGVGRGGREENCPKTLFLLGNAMTIKKGHMNLRKMHGTPAGCPWDTRRDKQGSTGRCP